MKFKRFFLLIVFTVLILKGHGQEEKTVKIACIGNSITYGHGIRDRIKDAYPAQLNRMLGEGYDVKNFGVSGTTLLSKGNRPYIQKDAYRAALAYQPNIVIIKLGTNDSKDFNWVFKRDFETDYKNLIASFRNLDSKPTIYICLAAPVFEPGKKISAKIVTEEVNPMIKAIAEGEHLALIDLYTPLLDKGNYFPDAIHPNAQGCRGNGENRLSSPYREIGKFSSPKFSRNEIGLEGIH